jgi:hypothetical protein
MLEFDAGVFTIVMRDLSNAAAMLVLPILNGHGSDKASTVGERLNDALARVSVHDPATGFLPIPVRLRSKATRLLGRILADEITISETNTLIRDLHNDISISMGSLHFLMIDPSRLSYYTQKEPPFGVEVALKFHEAFADIEAASRCVALEEWMRLCFTSCVCSNADYTP